MIAFEKARSQCNGKEDNEEGLLMLKAHNTILKYTHKDDKMLNCKSFQWGSGWVSEETVMNSLW